MSKEKSPISTGWPNVRNWMTYHHEALKGLKLHELSLPGTHNAGMDKKGTSGIPEGWISTQDDSWEYQVGNGVRVLDLRIREMITVNEFRCFHGGFESSRTVRGLIDWINGFFREDYASKKNEILILDIHDVDKRGAGAFNYAALKNQIKSGLTSTGLIPRAAMDLTLAQLHQQYPGKNIVLCWDQDAGEELIWPEVKHLWIGEDLPTEQALNSFVSSELNQPRRGYLNSMQYVRYEALYGAIDMEDQVNTIFAADALSLYLANIVNVDFFGRNDLVPNCIAANLVKAVAPRMPSLFGVTYYWDKMSAGVGIRNPTQALYYLVSVNGGPFTRYDFEVAHNGVDHIVVVTGLARDTSYLLTVLSVSIAGRHSAPTAYTLITKLPDPGPRIFNVIRISPVLGIIGWVVNDLYKFASAEVTLYPTDGSKEQLPIGDPVVYPVTYPQPSLFLKELLPNTPYIVLLEGIYSDGARTSPSRGYLTKTPQTLL